MVGKGLAFFDGKNVLLLQGPVGPFFERLALDLEESGARVFKINFNGGDWFFSPRGSVNFTGSADEWPGFFTEFLGTRGIDVVLMFGDCRGHHRIAHTIATNRGIEVGVFEEGYVRPDFITFERFGVNGFSRLPRNRAFYDALGPEQIRTSKTRPVKRTFWYAAGHAIVYYGFSSLLFPVFRKYRHHRPLSVWEGAFWIRSLWRKWLYRARERGIQQVLSSEMRGAYFLVPLQIATDAQVWEHSTFASVQEFIERVISSFAAHAPVETRLVIKHHPLDRGYHDYCQSIREVAARHGVGERVVYLHDQHLPTLLEHARGVVVINSTVGLSAIHRNVPLKVCGTAIYDIEGLTYQGSLEDFWEDAERFRPDRDLYERFRGYLVNEKQINGSFYRQIRKTGTYTGTRWVR